MNSTLYFYRVIPRSIRILSPLVPLMLATLLFGQTQPGLLQEWVGVANPGNRDAIVDLIENEGLLVPPFHASDGVSWWTGNQASGWDVPRYPAEVIASLSSATDAGNYVVRSTGEILIPESGTYRFADGNDDYAYWAIDLDGSGVAGDDFDEVIIDDNAWTSVQRTENNGGGGFGEVEIDVPAEGAWLSVEFLAGEGVGSDAGVMYWDYGTDGGGLNAADGFPDFTEDPIDPVEGENWLIPDTHLRAPAGPAISGPANYVAGWGRIGVNDENGGQANEVLGPGGELQPGLLQEWVNLPNPGNRAAIIDLIENEELIVDPFHSSDGTTWWTGNQAPGWEAPQYPIEIAEEVGFPTDFSDYVVRATGEIFIPESGLYRFADANDDYAYWAVDGDKSGVAGDSLGEVIIDDNAWTDVLRTQNAGGHGLGEIEIQVAEGGEWVKVEFLAGEGGGTDAGIMYWDYDVDGGGLNAADGFPELTGDPIDTDILDAERLLIPDTHLRAPGDAVVISADLLFSFDSSIPHEFDVDASGGNSDKIVINNRDPNVFTTVANVDGATLRINPLGPVSDGDSFDLIDADRIDGMPTILSTDPSQNWVFNSATGEVTLSGQAGVLLKAGDANQDLQFNQGDLVQVLGANTYLTGADATWGTGDWDAALTPAGPGTQGNPNPGDGRFNPNDIVAALQGGAYLTGPYAALSGAQGSLGDGQTSLVYDQSTGELSVDAPAGKELTSINITSADNKFVGDKPAVLDGAFDNFATDNVFKATFGGSFGSISFGNVLPAGLSEADVTADLTAVGSLAGGGDLGAVDLVFIPEPASMVLMLLGLLGVCRRKTT